MRHKSIKTLKRKSLKRKAQKRLPTGVPNPVDVHVGYRLRLRRVEVGLSQAHLGKAVGLTFQQIQKYERGGNRIGASRLYQFSQILDRPVPFFFYDMLDEKNGHDHTRTVHEQNGTEIPEDTNIMTRRETLEFVRAYYRITDLKSRKRIFELTKALGNKTQK